MHKQLGGEGSNTAPWVANTIALFVGAAAVWTFALALLWRIGSWHVSQTEALIEEEGLPVGSEALQVAAHARGDEFHLDFLGRTSFVVFGLSECAPCTDLLVIATQHPATSHMRLVYLSDSERIDIDPDVAFHWEVYRLHDGDAARRQWRAPVSPYFHVIDESNRIQAKGVANKPDHLDRLLALRPTSLSTTFDDFRPEYDREG